MTQKLRRTRSPFEKRLVFFPVTFIPLETSFISHRPQDFSEVRVLEEDEIF